MTIALARARIAQAFGRLIRRGDDKGGVPDAGRRHADAAVRQPAAPGPRFSAWA